MFAKLQQCRNFVIYNPSPCISPLFLLIDRQLIDTVSSHGGTSCSKQNTQLSEYQSWISEKTMNSYRETSTSDLQRTFKKMRYSYSDSLRRRKLLPYLLSYFKQNIHDNCKNADDLERTCKHCSTFMSCIKFCHRCFLCMVLLNMWIHNIAISFSGYL